VKYCDKLLVDFVIEFNSQGLGLDNKNVSACEQDTFTTIQKTGKRKSTFSTSFFANIVLSRI
jgi:hypothetical protein